MAEGDFKGGARARRAVALIAVALTVILLVGLTWLRANSPQPAVIIPMPSPTPVVAASYSVTYDFISPSTGWAAVTDNANNRATWVFKTTDGAKHWQQIYAGTLAPSGAEVHFLDRAHGYLEGLFGQSEVFRTSDGGVHWQAMTFPLPASDFAYADLTHAWFLTFDSQAPNPLFELFSSTDGGISWTEGSWPFNSFLSGKATRANLVFLPDGEGWIGSSGNAPVAYSTSDGGRSWHAHTIALPPFTFPTPDPGKPQPPGPAYSVAAQVLPGIGVIAIVSDYSGNRIGFTSFDEGSTWRPVVLPNPATYDDITYVDGRHWWAWRFGFLFKTSDGGATWQETHVAPLLDNWIYSPAHVIDAEHAWSQMTFAARGGGSALSMTTDGGVSWHTVNVPKPG